MVPLLLSLLVPAAVQGQEPPPLDAEVVARIDDLEDRFLHRPARRELLACGEAAALALAERCLHPPRDAEGRQYTLWLPILQELGAPARPALVRALAVAQDGSQLEITRARARFLVEGLVGTVPAEAAEVAPLAASAAGARLRARLRLGASPDRAALAAALASSDRHEVEAALELIARTGRPDVPVERLAELWDERDRRAVLTAGEPVSPDHPRCADSMVDLVATALLAAAPGNERAGAALARLLDRPGCALQRLEYVERIAALGAGARDAVPALARACNDAEKAVCRAALQAVTRLGKIAAAAADAVGECADTHADDSTRRLARIALRRLSGLGDPDARLADLLADLKHPTRWRAALLEFGALGRPAAALAFVEFAGRKHDRWLWPQIVAAFGPTLEAVLIEQVRPVQDEGDVRAMIDIVDAAAGSAIEDRLAARLQVLAEEDANRARMYDGLRERLAEQRVLPFDASMATLRDALASESWSVQAPAARLLGQRGRLPAVVRTALRTVFEHRERADRSLESEIGHADARFAAALALVHGFPADPDVLGAYEWLLRNRPHPGLRLELYTRLGDFAAGAERAVALLPAALTAAEPEFVVAAVESLVRLGPGAASIVPTLEQTAALRANRLAARAAALVLAAVRRQGR